MIPVCEPLLDEKELAYVADCLNSKVFVRSDKL
jgi:hypothetical protein